AGTGQLALDILQALREEHQDLFDAFRYTIIEQSPMMRARQRAKLKEFDSKINWRDLKEMKHRPITGIIFSNELLDAFPVHRLRFSPKGIEELFVAAVSHSPEQHTASEKANHGAEERLAAAVDDSRQEQLAFVWQEL